MRVLMLGWEFPPHISGGLGTACHGLTQGLARAGVDILFVVPRARGDEHAAHLDIVGANQIPIEEREPLPPRPVRRLRVEPVLAEAPAAVPTAAPSTAPAPAGAVDTVAIDSLLSPYLDAQAYRARFAAEARAARAAARNGGPAPLADADGPAPGGVRAWIEETLEPGGERVRTRLLEFSGAYGHDLMEEVARYALAVESLASRERFDVIHAHDWMSVPAGIAARRASGKPLVFHVHACERDRSGERPDARVAGIEQLGLDEADRVVCVSHFTRGVLQKNYRVDEAKLRVVHNALTRDEQRERQHVVKSVPEPIVLFLGRVTAQKGPEYFLEAAARVARVRPDVKFVIAGSGDRLPQTIELCARLGLARNVHFTGFLQGADVERMYAMADVYVMPSVSEPFGISPLEAMALDIPVIISRQSGVSEVLRNALKVDYWDVQGIADKILAVLRHPGLAQQLQDEGRAEALALRWDTPAARVREAYAELVGVA